MESRWPGAHAALLLGMLVVVLSCAPQPSAPAAPATRPADAAPRAAATAPPAATAPAAPAAAVAGPTAAPPAEKVTIVQLGLVQDAPLFLADGLGYFQAEGIVTDSLRQASMANIIAPLASGQADVGAGSPVAGFFNALDRGFTIKVVADRSTLSAGHNWQVLAARKSLVDGGQLTGPADLRGRPVSVAGEATSGWMVLSETMRRGGLGKDDVNLKLGMTNAEQLAALRGGGTDVSLITEPVVSAGVASGEVVRWITSTDVYPLPIWQVGVLLYSQSFIQDRSAVADAFMRAYVKGARAYNDAFTKNVNREGVARILSEASGLDAALFQPGSMELPSINPDGRLLTESITYDQQWYLANGYRESSRIHQPEEFIDLSFVDRAVTALGPYPR